MLLEAGWKRDRIQDDAAVYALKTQELADLATIPLTTTSELPVADEVFLATDVSLVPAEGSTFTLLTPRRGALKTFPESAAAEVLSGGREQRTLDLASIPSGEAARVELVSPVGRQEWLFPFVGLTWDTVLGKLVAFAAGAIGAVFTSRAETAVKEPFERGLDRLFPKKRSAPKKAKPKRRASNRS